VIGAAYRRITGTPWTTTRSMSREYGPTLAARYPELAGYSDAELMSRPVAEILDEIELGRAGRQDDEQHLEVAR
jgi:hypothetical protein